MAEKQAKGLRQQGWPAFGGAAKPRGRRESLPFRFFDIGRKRLPGTHRQAQPNGIPNVAVAAGWIFFVAATASFFWFKILGLDFWLHVKLGEVIFQTRSLPATDPFSYILAGQPLQTHYEYLSQIVFYLLYALGGPTGFIVFRMACAVAVGALLLGIDKKNVWPNLLLVLWGLDTVRPGFVDRPQIFSFLFFTIQLVLAFRYLDEPSTNSKKNRPLTAMVAVEWLWANFHGGGHILGFLIFGSLAAQVFYRHVRDKTGDTTEMRRVVLFGAAMGAVSFLTPNTYHSYEFLFQLLGESSNTLIREWRVKPFPEYVGDVGLFWAVAGGALLVRRKGVLFNVLILGVLGVVSFRMQRLEVLFVLGALGVALNQMRDYDGYASFMKSLWARRTVTTSLTALATSAALYAWVNAHGLNELRRLNLRGFGVSAHAEGACDFLDRKNLTGKFFNNYDIGAYLIYRGYPRRTVFIDGRNADYGAAFTEQAVRAGSDPALWADMDKTHSFTGAIVDFIGIGNPNLPYVSHLDRNPLWALVYVDDWVAVYLKRVPENSAALERLAYNDLSVTNLEFGRTSNEPELRRQIKEAPRSIKGRIVLAHLLLKTGRAEEALRLAQEARAIHPYLHNVYELLGMAYAALGRWADAGTAFERAMALAPKNSPPINYAYLADVFGRAGQTSKSKKYYDLSLAPRQP
jgi:tetratricopeptide (TPR) repeat protein